MTEPAPPATLTAGTLLREARERQGMTLATLAAAIKVPPRKLDALERDSLDELPDLTFARALAQAVCRTLHIDAQPVLALLPAAPVAMRKLERLGAGLSTPLGAARRDDDGARWLRHPVFWAATLLLLAAAALWYGQPEWLARWRADRAATSAVTPPGAAQRPVADATVAAPAAPTPSDATPTPADAATTASSPAAVVETVHSAPSGAAAQDAPDATPAGVLVLRANGETWVEVHDGGGQVLLSRTLLAGETVGVDGALPLRAVIGNASATTISFRGVAVDLAAATRDNIARVELK